VTVGFHSPLPPARTGVADYARSLLRALQRRTRVLVNAPAADVRLYHLGNNQLHRDIYFQSLRAPGVVVLHDANLHHFYLGALTEPEYVAEFVYNYGEWSRSFAADLYRSRARSAADPRYFAFPMLRRVAESARRIVVHNPAARRAVLAHAPHADVIEIPHLFDPPPLPEPAEVIRLRARLGVPAATLLVGVFGHLRESKRLPSLLRALPPDAVLLISGDFASSDLERALTPLLGRPNIRRTPYLPEHDFWVHALAVDVCVNLRYPQSGETSGIGIRLMGLGKPVIATRSDSETVPEPAAIYIDPGAAEEEMLRAALEWLATDLESAREIGRRAAAHIAGNHHIDRVAESYLDALQACQTG